MSRKNNLKRRKQTVEYQQKREVELARKRREKQERKQQVRESDPSQAKRTADSDDDAEMDGVVGEDVRAKLSEIKNPKTRRRMENEIRRLASKGIVVRRKADRGRASAKKEKGAASSKKESTESQASSAMDAETA